MCMYARMSKRIIYLKRFPEELSGSGCFGSSIIRILSGSGYSLFWAQSTYAVASELTVTQCGCKDTDILMRKDMVTWMNRFRLDI
jgi:hypothetical protein